MKCINWNIEVSWKLSAMFKIIIQRNPAKMHFWIPFIKRYFIKKLSVIFCLVSRGPKMLQNVSKNLDLEFRTLLWDYYNDISWTVSCIFLVCKTTLSIPLRFHCLVLLMLAYIINDNWLYLIIYYIIKDRQISVDPWSHDLT